MGKNAKKPETPKTAQPVQSDEGLVKVTFTRAYNSGHAKYLKWATAEVTVQFAEALKNKGVI